jgi:hypothetical protein
MTQRGEIGGESGEFGFELIWRGEREREREREKEKQR